MSGRFLSFIAGFIILVAAVGPVHSHSLEYVEKQRLKNSDQYRFFDRDMPQFVYRDMEGNKARLERFKGRIIVLLFTNTNCLASCSAPVNRIVKIQSMINISPMRDLVQFVTVLSDWTDDTKAAVAGYTARQNLDPENWSFLATGPQRGPETVSLMREFGHKTPKPANENPAGNPLAHVIDAKGRWRANLGGGKFSSLKFVVYLNALYNDGTGIKDGHGK